MIDGIAVIEIAGTLVHRGAWIGQSSGLTSYDGIADATGIVVVRGPSIVSRAALAYDGTVDDDAKITTKLGQLAATGIIARDGV